MRKRIVLILLLLLLAAIFGAWSAKQTLVFRITSVDPAGGTIPTAQDYVRIQFNHQLAPGQDSSAVIKANKTVFTKISSHEIIINLAQQIAEGDKLKVELIGVKSNDGKSLSKDFVFVGKYVPFNQLSKAAQQFAISRTDNTENTHPLISKLPYETEDFSINYRLPDSSSSKVPLFIASKMVNYADPFAEPTSPSSLTLLRKSRDETLDWLKKNGYDPVKYRLVFSEPQLVGDYGGIYVKDFDNTGDTH